MEDFRNIDLDQWVRVHSRRHIFATVEKLRAMATEEGRSRADQSYIKQVAADLERAYARYMRPERALALLLELRRVSRREQLLTHAEAMKICDNGSHFEEGHILKHLGEICIAKRWPPYPSLIVSTKSGECGEGFYSAYGIGGPPEARKGVAKAMQEACFASYLPTQDEVLAAFLLGADD